MRQRHKTRADVLARIARAFIANDPGGVGKAARPAGPDPGPGRLPDGGARAHLAEMGRGRAQDPPAGGQAAPPDGDRSHRQAGAHFREGGAMMIWDTPPGDGWILWVAHPPAYKRTRVVELWRQG